MFEDNETLQMYIEESLDHLGDIESDLLEIEEAGADIDLDLVNNVFRAAHSIKGGAGFMGLQTIKDLAHNLENVLGLIRTKELIPDSDKINVLLKGFDQLEELLHNIEDSNEVDIGEHVTALEAIIAGDDAVAAPASQASAPAAKEEKEEFFDIVLEDGRVLEGVSASTLNKAISDGKNIFLAEYDVASDIVQKNRQISDIIDIINKSGIVIDSRMLPETAAAMENTPASASGPFQILFASIIELDMTETLCGISAERIHHIQDIMVQRSGKNEASTLPMAEKIAAASVASTPAVSQASAPKAEKKATTKTETKDLASSSKTQTSLRVNVGLLDTLMTLAGELSGICPNN